MLEIILSVVVVACILFLIACCRFFRKSRLEFYVFLSEIRRELDYVDGGDNETWTGFLLKIDKKLKEYREVCDG
jgi:hypothetical protein